MLRTKTFTLAAVILFVPGCVERMETSEAEHRLGGSFTAQATQADIEDFDRRMKKHNGETAIMESFPPQFSVDNFGFTGCRAAYAEAKNLTYVASVRECRPVVSASAGDGPTSTKSN